MNNDFFKALADPTRREILNMLKKEDLTAGEIGARFDMRAASISHHLSILRQAGLVSSEKKGQYIIYSLNMTVFQEILEWVSGFHKGEKNEN